MADRVVPEPLTKTQLTIVQSTGWDQPTVDQVSSVPGVFGLSVEGDTLVCYGPVEIDAARKIVTSIAKLIPGIPIKWASAVPPS